MLTECPARRGRMPLLRRPQAKRLIHGSQGLVMAVFAALLEQVVKGLNRTLSMRDCSQSTHIYRCHMGVNKQSNLLLCLKYLFANEIRRGKVQAGKYRRAGYSLIAAARNRDETLSIAVVT